ncbi:PTS transporter subunit EIIC [Vibrio sp. S4M6]|uniref:PTS sugar transporter subunit IIC n=1 Tax=Vibrio sinus TaxID=2946865 RepID=UPI002029F449|nr:PTS transporter subunit EIIC [Vibrio sinus]MCL9780048.1 PTS transporter subunit EIIC [Vibrio sinus]
MNHSLAGFVTSQLEFYLAPIARKLAQNVHLSALRDGFQLSMPFIFVGCMFVPIIFPPFSVPHSEFATWWAHIARALRPTLLPTYQLTLGVVGLIVAFGIATSLAKQYKLPERISGLTGCMAFLMLAGMADPTPQNIRYLGGAGIFTAIIASIYSVEVIRLFIKNKWYISMPEEVPLLTVQSFRLIAPIMIIMLTLSSFNLFLTRHFGLHFPQLIEEVFHPLLMASDTLTAVLISILICQLLWFVGIHGALVVTGIMNPFWMSNLLANQHAMEAGAVTLPHIYLPAFWDFFVLIGGVGSTLPLIYLAIKSRSIHLRSVGKVGLVPSIFNINEPILFGFPIIMNPIFMIPFVLVPMINATIAWYLTSAGILAKVVTMIPWSVPAPIGAAWASNGSFANAMMVVLAMVIAYFLYLPFFKAHEKILIAQQEERRGAFPRNLATHPSK